MRKHFGAGTVAVHGTDECCKRDTAPEPLSPDAVLIHHIVVKDA